MSTAANSEADSGTMMLPRDLTPSELAAAPILVTLDSLLVEGLTIVEDEAFQAALAR